MSSKTQEKDQLLVFANRKELASVIESAFGSDLSGRKACILIVSNNAEKNDAGFDFPDLSAVKRLLIVFEGRPVNLDAMNSWRDWTGEKMQNLFDLRMAFVAVQDAKSLKLTIQKTCAEWFLSVPSREEATGIEIATWVQMPKKATRKDDPSLLTMMFGSMSKLLTGLEVAARAFKGAVGTRSAGEVREAYLTRIDELLARGGPGIGGKVQPKKNSASQSDSPDLGLGNVTDRIPKVLLLGDTGVGKTLIASYLHNRSGLAERPLHISIPEFIGKEDMFEYKLFGYAAGNYTGGKPEGDHGLLLENVCRVVFLDEIGEANAEIQAKLLTFLDHLHVRPRGWLEAPFYCPVMIVAATNRDLNAKTRRGERLFRNDLFQRFTDVLEIPPLRERKQDFEFILDCLLQRESMNPERFVREIGADALNFLKKMDYKQGNFRELEDLFRTACRRAYRDDRPYLVHADFVKTP